MLSTFTIKAKCVMSDDELYRHISLALERNLPVIGQHHAHDGVVVLVGSGPSVEGQIESIKEQRALGRPIVALKDAHDWLQDNGIVPDYASAIDPQENQWKCFKQRHPAIKYFIGSQCHPSMFDHLDGFDVYLWHLYVAKGQSVPPHGTALIGGGTTTGLRTITLFYSMGYRKFELYGYDSCLKDGVLRRSGWQPTTANEVVNEIVVDGKYFYANPAMTAQASEFQNMYEMMPDIEIVSHGEGLITSIIEARNKRKKLSISFMHSGGPTMASYRYRAAIPASNLADTSLNDPTADILVFAKPFLEDLKIAWKVKERGGKIIVDYCDDNFSMYPHYKTFLDLADAVTCTTKTMQDRILELGRVASIIEDPYEFDEVEPHCKGVNLLWFGHAINYYSLKDALPSIEGYPLRVVSNIPGSIPWSHETMLDEFSKADIVIIPETKHHKSANRAVEAIRQGCFVVAESVPALEEIPGIWLGNIKDGIEWASKNQQEANERIKLSQSYVAERFAPRTQALAWSKIIRELNSTLEAGIVSGKIG